MACSLATLHYQRLLYSAAQALPNTADDERHGQFCQFSQSHDHRASFPVWYRWQGAGVGKALPDKLLESSLMFIPSELADLHLATRVSFTVVPKPGKGPALLSAAGGESTGPSFPALMTPKPGLPPATDSEGKGRHLSLIHATTWQMSSKANLYTLIFLGPVHLKLWECAAAALPSTAAV